jgi:hypothetical protein
MLSKCITIQVTQPKPVVIIDNIKASASTVNVGDTVTLEALLVNTGSANGTVVVTFKKGSTSVETKSAVVVPAMGTLKVTSLPITITDADVGQTMNFCADAQCQEC